MKKRGNASTQRRQMIYKKILQRLNFSLLSTNTKWMVFGITSSCSKRRSQCCSPLLRAATRRRAKRQQQQQLKCVPPTVRPEVRLLLHSYAILPIAISFWSLLVYHIVRTKSGIAISTYLATRRLPPPTPPFACCCHPLSFQCRRVILLIIECVVHY